MADRVLDGTDQYGSRILVVDENGNGDHTTIQAAIDAAYAQTPASDSRWLVLIAPGEYQEALTLYDYVDLAGYAPIGAHLISLSNQQIIAAGKEVTISNLYFSGANDPLISTGVSHTGTMRFVNCYADYSNAEITWLQALSGTVELQHCDLSSAGGIAYLTAGTLLVYNSILSVSGGDALDIITFAGAGTLEVYNSVISNIGSTGYTAINITNASASTIIHNSVLRKSSGATYSINTSTTPAVYIANSAANAAIHGDITGTHDLQVDANY